MFLNLTQCLCTEMCLCANTVKHRYMEREWVYEQFGCWRVFPECVDFRAISHQPRDGGVKQTGARIDPNGLLVPAQGQRDSQKQKQKEIEKHTQEARGTQNKTIIIFCPHFFPSLLVCKLTEVYTLTHAHTLTHRHSEWKRLDKMREREKASCPVRKEDWVI